VQLCDTGSSDVVIPAQAGIQNEAPWVPAFAGTTNLWHQVSKYSIIPAPCTRGIT